jgi:2-iminobutanoate/2-iminopropanoate deaminase
MEWFDKGLNRGARAVPPGYEGVLDTSRFGPPRRWSRFFVPTTTAEGADSAMREEFRVRGLAEPISHYTDAVRYGDLLFISGVAPIDENAMLVGGEDVTAQARQVFINMKIILEAAGATFDKVLKVTVYLTNVADRTKINHIRQEFFGAARPASTLIGVRELAIPGMKVEVEAVVGLK